MLEYDLTAKIAQYLDRHMIFPLLEFLSSRKIYDEKSISVMKLDLLNKTNMVDFAVDCYRNLYSEEEIPEGKINHQQTKVYKFSMYT
jgi:translation initiation factor 3 subunit E